MKQFLILIAFSGLLFTSCKQEYVTPASTVAAFNFVNANVGTAPLVTRFNNKAVIFSKLTSTNEIGFGASNVFSPASGNATISFTQATDTTHTLFAGAFNLQNNGIYSFFLAGTVTQPDTVFIHEHLPVYAHSDSVTGIRFINLSPGSDPISVDIQGQANGSEVARLAYKSYTDFKTYTADHTVSSYVFEFRDQASGNLLSTYTIRGVNNATGKITIANTVRFHNMTIALIGQSAGGTVALKTLLVPNY